MSVHPPTRPPLPRPAFFEVAAFAGERPEELDALFEAGWNRIGPYLLRMPIGYWMQGLRAVVDIRLPLASLSLSANQRRVVARNRRRFRITVRRPRSWRPLERLYRAQMPRFSGTRFDTLFEFVGHDVLENPYPTKLLSVWHGNRRVAATLFDEGARSAYGVLSMHDPAWSRRSLGWYALLELALHLRDAGVEYLYPGYVMLGLELFRYKLRLRPLEFRDPRGRWRPLGELDPAETAAARMTKALERAKGALNKAGVRSSLRLNPWFPMGAIVSVPHAYSPFPAHLDCGRSREAPWLRIGLAFDPMTRRYCVLALEDDVEAREFAGACENSEVEHFGCAPHELPAWCVAHTLYAGRSSRAAVQTVLSGLDSERLALDWPPEAGDVPVMESGDA